MRDRVVLAAVYLFCAGLMFGSCVGGADHPFHAVACLMVALTCGAMGAWLLRR